MQIEEHKRLKNEVALILPFVSGVKERKKEGDM